MVYGARGGKKKSRSRPQKRGKGDEKSTREERISVGGYGNSCARHEEVERNIVVIEQR